MKKTLRRYVLALFVCVFAAVFGLGIMTACGDTVTDGGGENPGENPGQNPGENPGDGPVDEKKSYTLTLSLDGGSLDETEYSVEEGSDLLTFLQDKVPAKDSYQFGKWTLGGADVTADTKMPSADTTLTAVWKSPVTVTVYTLDFEKFDDYGEGTATTVYAYAGETLEASAYVPEHYELNEELTETLSVTVPETTDAALSVYTDPAVHQAYTDVFESTDVLFEFEADMGVLYLNRVEMKEGRKKCTSYDPATGAFTFKTGEADGAFVLEGAIAGEKFYYYRDTINRTFDDYLESGATLTIESPSEVTYTPAEGAAQTGSYSIDAEKGVYVFTPAQGSAKEFVLIEVAGLLYFRMHDGLSGWYAYDGEFEGGGWSILGFDGFGVATSVEDDGVSVQYDYIYQENGTIDVFDLGLIKLNDGAHADLGGYKISGTFSQSDGYEGEYIYVNGHRIDVLTLDGFGGAVHTYHTDDETAPSPISDGTYTIERDETWTIRGGGQVGDYSGVNEYINYTALNREEDATDPVFSKGNGSGKVVLSESTDDEGNTVNRFAAYYVSDDGSVSLGAGTLSVLPGAYPVTNSFVFHGATYVVDDTHKAFLYFYNRNYGTSSFQEVDLWYGTYNETLAEDVYQILVWGGWAASWNELYNPDDDLFYDGMYFKDMAEDKSFEFDSETWDGETEDYVFYSGEEGKLIIDVFGDAYWVPADGDPVLVDYELVAQGLIFVFEFDFSGADVPKTLSSSWAMYDSYYDVTAYEETYTYYDLTAESSKVYQYVTYADPYDGDIASIVVVDGVTFIGFWFEYTDGSIGIEYIYAGTSTLVQDSKNEFTFSWNDKIYYEDLDILEIYYDVADFHDFQYKVSGDKFAYGDGVVLSLSCGEDTLTTDGYGNATLTVGGTATNGTYEMDYDLVLFFVPEKGDPDEDSLYFRIDTENNTFVEINFNALAGQLYGYYFTAVLDETGSPVDFNTADMLFLDGVDGFVYEVYDYYEDTYEIFRGTYAVSDAYDDKAAFITLDLTFGEGDVRETRIYFVSYDIYDIGLYAIRNDALLGEYTAYDDNGEKLGTLMGGEGYYEEDGIFFGEDEDGSFAYDGYMARGFIDDRYYNVTPQFTADKDGDVVIFVTWGANGDMVQYVFDIDEEDPSKVVWRSMFYGAVGEYKVVGGLTGKYLYLDGHGSAALYSDSDAETPAMSGTYEFVETMENTYAFKSGGKVQFLFKPTSMEYGGSVISVYYQYFEEDDLLYVNDDWSILKMDGFGKAAYVDKYGVVLSGEYYIVVEDETAGNVYCLKMTGSKRVFYTLNSDNTFSICEGEYLIRNGVLYSYFGTEESITIPESVTKIAKGAFILTGASNIREIDLNKVTEIEAEGFLMMSSLEKVVSQMSLKVGASAFEGSKSLATVEFPNATEIGDKAFYGCDSLATVKLGKVQKIGAYAFSKNISLTDVPLTLDLTAATAEDLGNLTVDLTAFLGYMGYIGIVNRTMMIEGSKVLVGGGVDALNAAAAKLKGKTASISYHDADGSSDDPNVTGQVDVDLTPYLALPAVENDPASGLAFYDLKTDSVLVFDSGVATVYTSTGYSYGLSKSYPYYIDKDGKAVLFSKDEAGAYKADLTLDVSATSVTLETVNYTKAETPATATATVNGKNVVITYEASVSTGYGIYVTLDVTAVTYDGAEATGVSFDSYDGILEFTADGHGFVATLENGKFTVEDTGVQYVLTNTEAEVWFRLTVGVSEGKAVLKKFEYNTTGADGSYYEAYFGYTETADNTWSYTTNYVRYTLKVTVPAQGEPTLSVTNDGYVIEKDGFVITLKVNEDFTQIEQIIEIKQNNVALDISKISYNEGKTSATLTVENNGTYIIAIAPSQYAPNFTLTITHTDYDTTKSGMVLDGDDYYWVELNVHFDAEGKATIKGITRFEDFMTDTPIPYTTATPNDDGSLTVALQDGRTAKFTIEGDSIKIAWVQA